MSTTTTPSGQVTTLKIKVVPGASRSGVSGWLGDALKIRVAAPPEKGKANQAVEAVLCKALKLASRDVRIVRGKTSPNKICEVYGLSPSEIQQRLDAAIG